MCSSVSIVNSYSTSLAALHYPSLFKKLLSSGIDLIAKSLNKSALVRLWGPWNVVVIEDCSQVRYSQCSWVEIFGEVSPRIDYFGRG